MYSVVFLVKKKADMTQDEFARFWIEDHTPFTAKVAGIRSYRVYPFHDGQTGPFDGAAVISFDDQESCERALASPEFEAALADAVNFQTINETISFTADEFRIV
jgi:uncharacterized protein (TIGR02118 family)